MTILLELKVEQLKSLSNKENNEQLEHLKKSLWFLERKIQVLENSNNLKDLRDYDDVSKREIGSLVNEIKNKINQEIVVKTQLFKKEIQTGTLYRGDRKISQSQRSSPIHVDVWSLS